MEVTYVNYVKSTKLRRLFEKDLRKLGNSITFVNKKMNIKHLKISYSFHPFKLSGT